MEEETLTVNWVRNPSTRFPEVNGEWCAKYALCSIFLISISFLSIFYALSDQGNPSLPSCSIQSFYIPALDISLNSTSTKQNENQTIYFDLKLRNKEMMIGIYYDPLNLTFSYSVIDFQNKSTISVIANLTYPGFYQGYGKTAHRIGLAETHPLEVAEIRRSLVEREGLIISSLGILRIELRTGVRFKSVFGNSERRWLSVGTEVEINEGGQMVGNKGIELTADQFSAAIRSVGGYYVPMIVFWSAFILAFI